MMDAIRGGVGAGSSGGDSIYGIHYKDDKLPLKRNNAYWERGLDVCDDVAGLMYLSKTKKKSRGQTF